MRLLIIAAGYKPSWVYGGPTISISSMAEALSEEGVDVTVMTTNANGQEDFTFPNGHQVILDGVQVQYYRRWFGDPMSISPLHTWALIKSIRQYDIVHINGWWNWVAMMSLIVCKVTGIPHVLTTRGALSEYTFQTRRTSLIKRIMHQLFFKRMLCNTLLHVTTEEEAQRFRNALPGAKVVVLPNIIHLYAPVQRNTVNDDLLRLVFLGRIDPVKNLELMVQALNSVKFPYQFILIGDGKPEYVRGILQKSVSPERIQCTGAVYGDGKYKLLADADVLVLVSHSENFGNVVIEAMSQGTPVLLTRQVGLSNWVKENHLGWIIEPDVAACKEALEDIYAHRDQLDQMRTQVLSKVEQDFSTPKLVSRYIHECYQQVYPAAKLIKPKMEVV